MLASDKALANEDFDDVEFVDFVGTEAIAANGKKDTAKGERTKAGLLDIKTGNWLSGPVLGGTILDVYGGVCSLKIAGGYSDEFSDGCGLMASNGEWIYRPDRKVDGLLPASFKHYADTFWTLRVNSNSSKNESAVYLFDASKPNQDPVRATGIVDIDKEVYVSSSRDDALIDAVTK